MKRTLTAGIDISAKQLVVAIEGSPQVFAFANDEAGHEALRKVLKKQRVGRVTLEPTGNYGLDVMVALDRAGFAVMSVNPRAARRFAQASMKRAKTDQVDANVLLSFGLRMDFVRWTPPRQAVLELRSVSRRLQQVVKTGAAEKARYKAAQATGTTPPAVLESLEKAIAYLEQAASALVDAALDIARQDQVLGDALELLTTIRGVADRSAVKLLAELAALPEDLVPRQLVAMVGLDPRPVESGTFAGQRRISKLGNAHIRAALFMAAHNAILYEPVVTGFYNELIAANKHPMKAKVAVMRKLLHSMWGMLRSHSPFDPQKFRHAPARAAA